MDFVGPMPLFDQNISGSTESQELNSGTKCPFRVTTASEEDVKIRPISPKSDAKIRKRIAFKSKELSADRVLW